MQYQEFLTHIYQKYSGNVKLGLERMQGLLEDMGHPEGTMSGFHVAGTNGKGSVCAALEALALAHGLSTGLNTSPHLIDYTERFRYNGVELDFREILAAFQANEEHFVKWDASFFEITTAIAFYIFANRKPDVAVIEVGLGGRLDATNLFSPNVSAITTIGLDHIKTLGGTVELIAAEKAGIIKEGIPLVLGDITASPKQVILNVAAEKQIPVYQYGRDFHSQAVADDIFGLTFDYSFNGIDIPGIRANLIGEHQAVNMATAITCFALYARQKDIILDPQAVRHAIANVRWQGRMQVLSHNPPVIIDGAHNVQGITALLETTRRVFPERKPVFVISILADKDYSEMVHLICSAASRIYVARNESDRAASVEDQMAEVAKHDVPAIACQSVADAYAQAVASLRGDDVLICGGSLYTVGEVLKAQQR